MSFESLGSDMVKSNARTQVSLAIFCGIGILFIGSIVWGLSAMFL